MLILSFILFFALHATAQRATYNISIGQIKVGEQWVIQKQNADTIKLEVGSDVKVLIGVRSRVSYRQTSTFVKGQLIYAKVVVLRNDVIHRTTTTEWRGSHYLITTEDSTYIHRSPIRSSGSLLYFQKPKPGKIYVESDGRFRTLQKNRDGSYKAYYPGEKGYNSYEYKAGILRNSSVNTSWLSFNTKLVSTRYR